MASWAVLLIRTVRGALRDDFGIAASSIAFAAFLAILPLASLVTAAYGLLASPARLADHLGTLIAVLPSDAQVLVREHLDPARWNSRDGLAVIAASIVIALFSARRAGRSLLHGLNLAYGIRRERRGLRRQLVSTLLVLGCAALVLTALVSLSLLAFLQSYVPDGLPGARLVSTALLAGSLTLGAGSGLLLVYRYAPAAKKPIAWRRVLPGTIAGVAMWLGATLVFRFYVTRLARFDDVYGSLTAVVVLMLWLMVSAWALLLGARLNAEAMRAAGCHVEERPE